MYELKLNVSTKYQKVFVNRGHTVKLLFNDFKFWSLKVCLELGSVHEKSNSEMYSLGQVKTIKSFVNRNLHCWSRKQNASILIC